MGCNRKGKLSVSELFRGGCEAQKVTFASQHGGKTDLLFEKKKLFDFGRTAG